MNTTVWRWFPLWLGAAMGVVFAVNAYMVYDAYHTFPGSAGPDGFDLSNKYTQVLAAVREQTALGWKIDAAITAERFPELVLANQTSAPLTASGIEARAERPVGPTEATVLTFRPTAQGRYQADTSLFAGQWDLLLTVHADGHSYSATRRVVVK